MSSGDFGGILGESVFAKYDVNPWYERFHSSMLTIYLVFLVTFGLGTFIDSIHCVPKNATVTSEFSEVEANYISAICQTQARHYDPTEFVFKCILITMAILFLGGAISSFILEDYFSTFATARKIFSQSFDHTRSGLWHFNKVCIDPTAKELRDVVRFLKQTQAGLNISKALLWRSLLLSIGMLMYGSLMWAGTPHVRGKFTCDAESEFAWTSNNATLYTCALPWARDRNRIAIIYEVAIGLHTFVAFCSLIWIAVVRQCCHEEKPNPRIESAWNYIFIAKLTRSADNLQKCFSEFVENVMSSRSKFTGVIEAIGNEVDPLLEESGGGEEASEADSDAEPSTSSEDSSTMDCSHCLCTHDSV